MEVQQRIKRLERLCLLLCVAILLLAVFGVLLALNFGRVVTALNLFSERIDFICQAVDAVSNCIQGVG